LQGADNILLNPGFEGGGGTPAHWSQGRTVAGVRYIWDKENGHESDASLCLHKTAGRFFPIAQWYQIVEREGSSAALEVCAQVKAEQVTKAILDVGFLDGRDKPIGHKWASYIGRREAGDPPANHDWKAYSGRVDLPGGARKIRVGLQIYGPGKVWFDDVRATYVDANEVASPAVRKKGDASATDDIADVAS
jgi:RNA polymerase sigma-70 factor (ECF subfamily)